MRRGHLNDDDTTDLFGASVIGAGPITMNRTDAGRRIILIGSQVIAIAMAIAGR